MRPASESSHHRNDRRDGPRGPPRGGRQTWVPKGSEISSNLNVNGGESQANVNPIRPRPNWESPNNTNPCRLQPDCESHTNVNPNRLRSNCEPHNNANSNRPRPNCESQNNVSRPRSNVNRRSYVVQHVNKEVAENSDAGGGSSVPQLVQEIQDKLTKGTVECMICYDMVRRSAAVWSCSSCFSIFHLMCIKKWARAPTSIDVSAEKDQGLNWRCPGCQSVQLVASKEIKYTCFCGKLPDPPSDLYLTPHSCGESCGKALEREVVVTEGSDEYRCSHLCVLQCHPGPCPPCKAFAPSRQCPCGKKTINRRCSDRKTTPSCGLPCNKVLECGRHRCERTCHVGPCDSCKVLVNASCFCKKKTEVVFCGEMALTGVVDEINGLFSCKSVCGKILSCENHSCTYRCHPGICGDCDFLPGKIKTCYCGKTPLETERKSCLDPILMCSEVCGRALRCGVHQCKSKCHEGECPPCMVLVEQRCRCGSASRTVECYKTMEESYKFVCERPCGRKKNCGRHRCNERCCPLSSSNSRISEDWDPHLCSVVCGKKLRCGQHVCESLCHSGHCPPCLETIFTDLSCACGKTVIPPPLPCGTQPPACPHSCSFPQACGHSSTHSCHFGDCPPCAVPIAKECIGGHVVLRNIPCGSRDIRCNQLCGKTRQCGMHACARTCHPPPCDTSSGSTSALGSKVSCGQVCGAPRRDCRHTCTASCHPSSPCPDQRCNFPVTITCSCGRISASVPCDAGGSNPSGFHGDTVFEASVIQKLPVPLQPTEANGKKIPLGQRKLVCNEECAKLERKRLLADAFDITPPNLDSLHFGENNAVSEMLTDLFRREPKWVVAIEERLKFLVFGKNKGSSSGSLRVHVFSAAVKEKRDAIRQLAERWKLSIQAAGWEPRRFLVVHVTPKSKAPARILGARPGTSLTGTQPPVFDPSIDMDPRLVVALLDLPRDADISTLVLRFGGECELVWLNDKNALAIFSDPARATTALRRLDHGSVYQGAVVLSGPSPTNTAWGAKDGVGNDPSGATRVNNPWKKAVVQELGWNEDSSWGHNWPNNESGADSQLSAWRGKEASALVTSSRNRWDVLNTDLASNSTSATNLDSGQDHLGLQQKEGSSLSVEARAFGGAGESGQIEELDDWEKAFE